MTTNPVVWGYNSDDDLASKTLGNGWSMGYQYDVRRRIQQITDSYGGDALASTTYGRDDVGNITSATRAEGSNGLTTSFGYDDADRLTTESRTVQGSWPSSLAYSNSYAYDKNDNRLSVTRNGVLGAYSYYTCNGSNTDEIGTGDNWTQGNYDADGNPAYLINWTTNNRLNFTYNQEEKPTVVAFGTGGQDEYYYDGDGRMVAKYNTNTSTWTTEVYDGNDVVVEVQGSTTTFRLPGVMEFCAADAHPNLYQMEDGRGSTIAETPESGSFLGEYDYDGYGMEQDVTSKPQGTTNFRFAGKHGYLYDEDTDAMLHGSGLILCGSRFYIAGIGRFLTQDPIGEAGGMNLYGYCGDNPVNAFDPGGQDGFLDFTAGAGDTLSFGLTKVARRYIGEWAGIGDANEQIDYGSGFYTGGEIAGAVLDTAIGGGGGWKVAGEKTLGKEVSHWIPARLLRRTDNPWLVNVLGKSKLNVRFVTAEEHALMDPYRYRFMSRAWKEANRMPNTLLQQLRRVPSVYRGAALGAGTGASHRYIGH